MSNIASLILRSLKFTTHLGHATQDKHFEARPLGKFHQESACQPMNPTQSLSAQHEGPFLPKCIDIHPAQERKNSKEKHFLYHYNDYHNFQPRKLSSNS